MNKQLMDGINELDRLLIEFVVGQATNNG